MKHLNLFLTACILFTIVSCQQSTLLTLENESVKLTINKSGIVNDIVDIKSGTSYKAEKIDAPILSLRKNGKIEAPQSATWDQTTKLLTLDYPSETKVQLEVLTKKGYFTLEIKTIEPLNDVDLAIWGPYPTTISQTVGECVGVVRDSTFAFGIRALNTKTMGGYPDAENDIDPTYNIIAPNSLADVAATTKILYRSHTAKHTSYGSSIQAYVRNRNKDRVISMWGHKKYTAPAFNDGGIIGSKIALFGSPERETLNYLEQIVLGENLPHPMINGQWSKKSPDAAGAYIIYPFNENNIEEALAFTKRTGLKCLYHGGSFKTWGNFKLNPNEFPSGLNGLKTCVKKANAEGINIGIHTLSNFITTNDAYVSPIPTKHLAKVGTSTLTSAISSTNKTIEIASADFFNQMSNNTLHGVMIGEELIRYEKVSDAAPWKLLNCERGAWGTKAASHISGTKAHKLMDHGYKVFLSDTELTKEIARNIANIFNKTGIMQISFDGLEGAWSTGLGQYGLSMMVSEWYNHLNDKYKNCINDASMTTHYNWTIFTRMNWGEPWYAGFRESQVNYRIINQDFYRRNLMPSMLGWFKYDEKTSIEDIQWLLARSAAFDAGYALATSKDAVTKNGKNEQIIKAIREWEHARLQLAFPKALKKEMEHLDNEYSLTETSDTSWDLTPIHVQRFKHLNMERQPGEPVQSKWICNNPYSKTALNFIIKADDDIKGITLNIGGFTTLKIKTALKKGQYLKYEGGNELMVCDTYWNVLNREAVDASQLMLPKGNTTIDFACQFSSKDAERKVSAELRIAGKIIKLNSKIN